MSKDDKRIAELAQDIHDNLLDETIPLRWHTKRREEKIKKLLKEIEEVKELFVQYHNASMAGAPSIKEDRNAAAHMYLEELRRFLKEINKFYHGNIGNVPEHTLHQDIEKVTTKQINTSFQRIVDWLQKVKEHDYSGLGRHSISNQTLSALKVQELEPKIAHEMSDEYFSIVAVGIAQASFSGGNTVALFDTNMVSQLFLEATDKNYQPDVQNAMYSDDIIDSRFISQPIALEVIRLKTYVKADRKEATITHPQFEEVIIKKKGGPLEFLRGATVDETVVSRKKLGGDALPAFTALKEKFKAFVTKSHSGHDKNTEPGAVLHIEKMLRAQTKKDAKGKLLESANIITHFFHYCMARQSLWIQNQSSKSKKAAAMWANAFTDAHALLLLIFARYGDRAKSYTLYTQDKDLEIFKKAVIREVEELQELLKNNEGYKEAEQFLSDFREAVDAVEISGSQQLEQQYLLSA